MRTPNRVGVPGGRTLRRLLRIVPPDGSLGSHLKLTSTLLARAWLVSSDLLGCTP
jgi:hypothetical protein